MAVRLHRDAVGLRGAIAARPRAGQIEGCEVLWVGLRRGAVLVPAGEGVEEITHVFCSCHSRDLANRSTSSEDRGFL